MKKQMIFFIIGCLLLSCGSDTLNDKNNATSTLIFQAVVPRDTGHSTYASSVENETSSKNDTLAFFTGQDIVWFNETTGELKLTDGFTGIIDFWEHHDSGILLVGFDDESLFSMELLFVWDVMSQIVNSPVLYFKDSKIFIKDGYPDWEWLKTESENPDCIERNENWKKIEQGWNKFIAQLKKEGKYRK
jgi:hypothetical protein